MGIFRKVVRFACMPVGRNKLPSGDFPCEVSSPLVTLLVD
jgi:hypothetical protein